MDIAFTSSEVLLYLQITIAVVVLVVLYHVLFIVVDVRKILKRVEFVTKEVENIVMKPISAADFILEGVTAYFEKQSKPKKKKSSSKKK